jgi:hypothetical protein
LSAPFNDFSRLDEKINVTKVFYQQLADRAGFMHDRHVPFHRALEHIVTARGQLILTVE